MIEAVDRSLIRADTGIYGYPALLYFLEMEFNRSSRYGKPFSLLMLQIGTKTKGALRKNYYPCRNKLRVACAI